MTMKESGAAAVSGQIFLATLSGRAGDVSSIRMVDGAERLLMDRVCELLGEPTDELSQRRMRNRLRRIEERSGVTGGDHQEA